MTNLELSTYREMGLSRVQPVEVERRAGYLFSNNLLRGVYLLGPRNFGKQLLIRLKNSEGELLSEIDYWAGAMASMLEDYTGFECVSYPPTSHPGRYYLAARLAKVIGDLIGLPVHEHFTNNNPRNTKCSIQAKLHEKKDYSFSGECQSILMVDDAVSTRKTADACLSAAGNRSMFWLFLYASKFDGKAKFTGKSEGVVCAA